MVYDPLLLNKAYGSSGSILEDLISRSSHSHPLFKTDNATVYNAIEEATRVSIYATTIKSFARKKDGRGAWLSIVTSHVGVDKWERIQKECSSWLMTAKWNGKKYPLESFCSQHRAKHQQLLEAAQYIDFQVPNSHTRVGYIMDNLENSDAALQAAIASIRQNVNDSRNDFEKAIAILLPVDPHLKLSSAKKAVSFEVSSVSGNTGRGKTGVDLRWYTVDDYKKLSNDEKDELREWQSSKDGKKTITTAKNNFLAGKRKRSAEKTDTHRKDKKATNKQTARIAALEKQLEEQNQVAELAVVLQGAGNNMATSRASSETLARKVMAIVARKNTDKK